MKRILSFLLFSFFALPWLCSASVTGINVADVSYVADADTINVTISYLYETPGEVAPQGFIIRLVGMDDLGYSFTSPAFGPLDFVPSDELATASYAITGLSASSSFSYTLDDAEPLVEIPYAYGTMETTATDGVFVDPGETVTPVGTPTDDAYYLLAPLPLEGIQTDAAGNQFLNIGANDGPTGPNFDFGDYVNGLLKFAIGIAGALAVVMIVIGGMQYMSTDNFGEKAQGKEQIKNAVGGILLLLGAYMILNTLNPNLVDFNFKISGVVVEASAIIDTGEYGEAPLKADGTFDFDYCKTPPNTAAGCASCKKIAGVTFKETITSDTNKNASSSFADALTSFASATPSASGEGDQWWVITEAYSPTFMGHCSQCHYNGTCIDAGFRGTGDLYAPENVKYFCQEAHAKGLEPVFEITATDDASVYTEAGISPLVVAHATGKHFSVYSDQKNRPGACGTVK